MKEKRHSVIVQLVEKYSIGTQEELAEKLREAGFHVTQATVSRDIRDLKLSKVPSGEGGNRYVVFRQDDSHLSAKFVRILKDGLVSMERAQNLLVVKTVSGMAMAVAAALDAMKFEEIVGCIAGDDTIMAATHSTEEADVVISKLEQMLEG
ncbi:MAG: arginine repressor [Clostridiales bacterium]|nr:arginine repressor [Clostridiales bacterium]